MLFVAPGLVPTKPCSFNPVDLCFVSGWFDVILFWIVLLSPIIFPLIGMRTFWKSFSNSKVCGVLLGALLAELFTLYHGILTSARPYYCTEKCMFELFLLSPVNALVFLIALVTLVLRWASPTSQAAPKEALLATPRSVSSFVWIVLVGFASFMLVIILARMR